MLEDLRNRNQSTAEEGQLGRVEAKAVLWCPHSLWWEPVSLVTGPCWPVGARLARDWQLCHSHASPLLMFPPCLQWMRSLSRLVLGLPLLRSLPRPSRTLCPWALPAGVSDGQPLWTWEGAAAGLPVKPHPPGEPWITRMRGRGWAVTCLEACSQPLLPTRTLVRHTHTVSRATSWSVSRSHASMAHTFVRSSLRAHTAFDVTCLLKLSPIQMPSDPPPQVVSIRSHPPALQSQHLLSSPSMPPAS